jgi:hypothetical protein
MTDAASDSALRERLAILGRAVPVPPRTTRVAGQRSTGRVTTRLDVPLPLILVALAIIGLVGAFGSASAGRTTATPPLLGRDASSALAAVTTAAPPATLPVGGIIANDALRLAKKHVPAEAVFVDAVAGPFEDVYTPPPNAQHGPDYPVKPADIVWVVTFHEDIVICPPDGSPCFPPRKATTSVFLDFVTGEFKALSTYAPEP